jgi:hypothetical protein
MVMRFKNWFKFDDIFKLKELFGHNKVKWLGGKLSRIFILKVLSNVQK